ncbi:MAG: metallophosphoesterase [Anaerolineales bacterium]|nr:metallophosphoesterase [Anaerolineales bacterium]
MVRVIAGAALGVLAASACLSPPPVGSSSPAPAATSSPTLTAAPSTPQPGTTAIEATAAPIPRIPTGLPLSDLAYAVPLTIRHVSTESATLYFELQTPSAGRVLVQPEDGSALPLEIALDPSNARWLRTLEGLSPATRYRVVVALEASGQPAQQPQFRSREWGPVSFRTVAEQGGLRIGVIGDASFGDPSTFELVRQMESADLDFVLHAGDVVDETEAGSDPFDSYAEKFFAPFEPLLTQMPVYTVLGNHDYDADIRYQGMPFYDHAFPPFPGAEIPQQGQPERLQYYAFARGQVQFLMLDSQVFFGVEGREEETRWLEERLSDSRYRLTIPVLHVAPYSSSSVHPTNSLPMRQGWVPLFEGAGVPLSFSGHFHEYERLIARGITFIVSGGGSSRLYAPGEELPESQVFARRTHFVLMEIDSDRIELTAIALGGEVLDQAVISLPPISG